MNTCEFSILSGTQFELCNFPILPRQKAKGNDLSWMDSEQKQTKWGMSIGVDDGTVWVRAGRTGQLQQVDERDAAILGFRVIQYGFSAALAMRTLSSQTMVNGLPALNFSVLRTRDSFMPTAESRHIYYVSERFTPYVGPPTDEILASKQVCPCCLIPFDSQSSTIVATCKCGLAYHKESPESHPDLDDSERLDCFGQIGTCSKCGRELTTQPSLAWDPQEL
ncbi:MAG: hypothetical protein U9N87_05645 [Planctomycetota bacterium]|nr:hypothetical protein [Planctomycetota bacterium]